jgi:hypothetical protein
MLEHPMAQTLLYRLFGLGKIPKSVLPALAQEGIVLRDEGVGGSVTFKNFRAPGKRYMWRRNWFTGSLVLTRTRFAAFTFSSPIVNVPLRHEKFRELRCSLEKATTLCIVFDPSAFNDDWSGEIECRYSSSQAGLFLDQLKEKMSDST